MIIATDRLRALPDPYHLPALDRTRLRPIDIGVPPRFLLLYGSLRQASCSRRVVEEAARLLLLFGAEVRIFDPADLPLPDHPDACGHPAVHALREHVSWADGQFWCSPEQHGQITAIMKLQADHLPQLTASGCATEGQTLAVAQVSGGMNSFNTVNGLRSLGRWMRMIVVPNQLSIGLASAQFDENGRMVASPYYDRLVDVVEELVQLTIAVRVVRLRLADRYSSRPDPGKAAR